MLQVWPVLTSAWTTLGLMLGSILTFLHMVLVIDRLILLECPSSIRATTLENTIRRPLVHPILPLSLRPARNGYTPIRLILQLIVTEIMRELHTELMIPRLHIKDTSLFRTLRGWFEL